MRKNTLIKERKKSFGSQASFYWWFFNFTEINFPDAATAWRKIQQAKTDFHLFFGGGEHFFGTVFNGYPGYIVGQFQKSSGSF